MHHTQTQMFFKEFEVSVAVKQFVILFYAKCGYQAIDGVANGDAKSAQYPIVSSRLDCKFVASNLKDLKLAQGPERSCEPIFVADSLQNFSQNQIGDRDARKAAMRTEPFRLRTGASAKVFDQN